jgi:formyltetrahydrofolate synthetase
VSFDFINQAQKNKDGKLIWSRHSRRRGEGKTTTTVGLATASTASARRP